MTKNFLCLNKNKTEVLVLGSEYYLRKLSLPTVANGNEQIVPAKIGRNIGFYFNSTMNLKKQVGETCKAAWLHLRTIGKIRIYMVKESREKLRLMRIITYFMVFQILFYKDSVGTKFCSSSDGQIPKTRPYPSNSL